RGVIARSQSRKGLAEEQPDAYKNVDEVVEVVHKAGISAKVARMRPIGVIKGEAMAEAETAFWAAIAAAPEDDLPNRGFAERQGDGSGGPVECVPGMAGGPRRRGRPARGRGATRRNRGERPP